ncbi:MAG: peptidoglycan DD-metalloendopeptidase family protein [Thermoleophilia bacterium]
MSAWVHRRLGLAWPRCKPRRLCRARSVLLVALCIALQAGSSWSPAAAIEPPVTSTTLRPPEVVELPLFQLPYAAGSVFWVTQGNAGPYTHQARGPLEFAWDFLMGEGTMVVAARAGRVVAVEGGMSGGGLSDLYGGRANYVLVMHADGRYSLYLHLATAGVLVSPGQWVEAGEGIGLSGSTGFSSGPHLHFQVQGAELPTVGRSLPVAFPEVGVPALGTAPVSRNRYVPTPPAPIAESGALASAGAGVDVRSQLLTHQLLPVSAAWVSMGGVSPVEVPVRLKTLDAASAVRVVASGTGHAALSGTVTTPTPGWVAVWAEYFDGVRWRVVADADGRPVAAAHDVEAASVFLAEPGVTAWAQAGAGSQTGAQAEVEVVAGRAVEAEFRVENAGGGAVRLLDVNAELWGPSGALESEGGGTSMYLRPGESGRWTGTFIPRTPGTFTVRPRARDAAGKAVILQPRRVGQPAEVSVTVVAGGGPTDPGDGSDEGGGGSGDEPPTFADLPVGHPAHDAVQALVGRGVVAGYAGPGGLRVFRPDEPVTRAQFAKMLVGARGLPVPEGGSHPFLDVERSGPADLYPDDYIAAAFSAGLLWGVSLDPPRFAPYSSVTRRQVALVAARAGLSDPAVPGAQWAAASRGEVAVVLARLLAP